MAADLTGVRRKLVRAKNKLDALSDDAAAYLDPSPFRITLETEGNHQGIVCHIDRNPNDSWADEMAEIAYQARSALDILIPQLVIDSKNTWVRGTQFPIFLNRDAYVTPGRSGKSKRDTMLKGVAKRHRSVIEDAQPYQRGRGAYRHPLAVLSTISNRDKHNDVYICVAASEAFAIKFIRPTLAPPDREMTIRLGEKFIPYPMADGQELFAVDWMPDPADPPAPMNDYFQIEPINIHPTLGFNSDGRTFTLGDLDRSILAVANIIDRCASRFKP